MAVIFRRNSEIAMRNEPALRLLRLARQLAADPVRITVDEIASRYGVSRRTAERMCDAVAEVCQRLEEVEGERPKRWRLMGGFIAAEMTPHLWAASVKMPVLMVQVLEDAWTRNPEDGQKTFDLLGSNEKELFWIGGTTRRFKDGYNHFGRHPEKVINFLEKHMD